VLGDERQDNRLVRFEVAHRLFFVAPHEARVTSDVRGEDSRKASLVNVEPLRRLGHGLLDATLGPTGVQEHRRRLWAPYSGVPSALNGGNYLSTPQRR